MEVRLKISIWLILLFGIICTEDDESHLTCKSTADCKVSPWIEPFPRCLKSKCVCSNRTCVHYSIGRRGTVNYLCGECGAVGSRCENHPCKYPGICSWDNYCHCTTGFLRKNVCIYYEPVSSTRLNITLIFILFFLILINRMVASWPFFRNLARNVFLCICCRRFTNFRRGRQAAQGVNPASGTKSAAFTISSSEFLATSNDPELEWALELSRQEANVQEQGRDFSVPGPSTVSQMENPPNISLLCSSHDNDNDETVSQEFTLGCSSLSIDNLHQITNEYKTNCSSIKFYKTDISRSSSMSSVFLNEESFHEETQSINIIEDSRRRGLNNEAFEDEEFNDIKKSWSLPVRYSRI